MERVNCLYHESSNVYLSMKLAVAETEKENPVFTYSSVSRELFLGLRRKIGGFKTVWKSFGFFHLFYIANVFQNK